MSFDKENEQFYMFGHLWRLSLELSDILKSSVSQTFSARGTLNDILKILWRTKVPFEPYFRWKSNWSVSSRPLDLNIPRLEN